MAKKHGYGTEENFPGSEYTADEWEFMRAMERYQKAKKRRYPTYREVLHVLRSLGYRKAPASGGVEPRRADEGEDGGAEPRRSP